MNRDTMQSRFEALMASRFEKRLEQAWKEASKQGVLMAGVQLIFFVGENGQELFLVPGWVEQEHPELARELREQMSEFAKWRADQKAKAAAK